MVMAQSLELQVTFSERVVCVVVGGDSLAPVNHPKSAHVSGVGGTGKSFLIKAIKLLVGKIWPSKEVTVAVAAPTGLAAFIVGGLTTHRLFQLPIEHDSTTADYWSLSKATQKVMKTKLRSLKLIVVDEISMVSSLTLTYMHLRLEELF